MNILIGSNHARAAYGPRQPKLRIGQVPGGTVWGQTSMITMGRYGYQSAKGAMAGSTEPCRPNYLSLYFILDICEMKGLRKIQWVLWLKCYRARG